ncbi:MAG: hypothetical protein HN564_04980 [Flavobacteriales bacterium]|jgi:hypothetical protein|nr:hypothetical protein [Flavobacteriales bacterium]
MNKQQLVKFISKYNLGGLVNSAILSFKDNTLNTRFTSGDKSLLGILSMDKWDFEDGEFGVYNTEQLVKLLSVLDDDVTMSVTKAGDKAVSIQLSDTVSKVNYMLTDTSVISRPPVPESLPQNFELKININPQFISKFISGKQALAETDTFTVFTKNDTTSIVIGYASVNTNRVTIPVSTTEYKQMDLISFNATNFKEILSANKECESALLEVSPDGIAKITFKIDNYKSTYYLVAVQDVD